MGNKKYVYPRIPGRDCYFVRFMGSGLANCLFVYARAIAYAHRTGARVISPTWFNISVGPYIRHQKDKRHYLGLFRHCGEVSGIKKIVRLLFGKGSVEIKQGLNNYFQDILEDSEQICEYLRQHICPSVLSRVNEYDFTDCVAVHIRLGDYPADVRVPLEWYKHKIEEVHARNPHYRFIVFSDGRNNELSEILSMPGVRREFFGNAIADIFAISRCSYLIGSDSTFSGWGAYLGQVPCIFYRKHYGPVLMNSEMEIVENKSNLWQ